MTVDMLVSVFILLAMFGFFALSLRKAYKFAHMQIHARLDLYPVPKEGGGRAAYGGQRLLAHKPSNDDGVHRVIQLLKQQPDRHGDGELHQLFPNDARSHVGVAML